MLPILTLLLLANALVVRTDDAFVGCYKDPIRTKHIAANFLQDKCLQHCRQSYYKYSFVQTPLKCLCSNYLSEQISNVTCDFFNVYLTGVYTPGPPRNFQLKNVTENSARLTWIEPESYIIIEKYKLKALILHTFSSYAPISPEWMFSNNTFQADLITLIPSTEYNMTLSAISSEGEGAITFQVVTTKVDIPDPAPEPPKIIRNEGTKMTIRINPAQNNNGPITAFKIIVKKAGLIQSFINEDLMGYNEAKLNDLNFYVTAEIEPHIKTFTIGDGKVYNRYFNAPLNPNLNYEIILGLISRFNGVERIAFSDPLVGNNKIIFFDLKDEINEESQGLIIGLSVAIIILTLLLIAGIVGFFFIKKRVVNVRRRLNDNQELTLHGAMIEVENNGYIHEEDDITPVNHYRSLKDKVKMIPSNEINAEPTNLLGIGKYGRVTSGKYNGNNEIAVYAVQDKKMSSDNRKLMLHDLDVLIKTGKNENLINLIGCNETSQLINVIIERPSINFKDYLLSTRQFYNDKFSTLSENLALDYIVQICNGMSHLTSLGIVHKQICARSIFLAGNVVKISNYGIAQYFNHNKFPDYTRWNAVETFQGKFNVKSDVWSIGCLIWEILSLGATPYGSVQENSEIPVKITKGLRLHQLRSMGDDIYQILIDCWQVNCDERPKIEDLIEIFEQLKQCNESLSFNLFSGFEYEQFHPDMELALKPMF